MEDTVSLVHQEGQMPAVKLKKGGSICVCRPVAATASSSRIAARRMGRCLYHTQEVKGIRLQPSAYKVSGLVQVNSTLFPPADTISAHAFARLFSPSNGSLLSHSALTLVSPPTAPTLEATTTMDDVADELKSAHISTLEREEAPGADGSPPFPPRKRLLFYPRSLKVQVTPLQCPPPLP
ncbi:hypothetical protein CLOM_g21157 [Closterium sp. NIES-68]|nr:hypothetical protein CLOM_g21157 [Closterium sp. NIES-68]